MDVKIELSKNDEAIANLVLGSLLLITNGFVFVVVVSRRSLRAKYLVFSWILFVNFLTGLMCLLEGIAAVVDDSGIALINVHQCLTNPILLLDIFVIPMNAVTMLTLSVDRLAAVARPVFYHRYSTVFVRSLLICAALVGISIFVFFTAAMLVAPDIIVPDTCKKTHMMPPVIYSSYLGVRVVLCCIFIILMIFVSFLLKRPKEAVINSTGFRESEFDKWQLKFTRTSLISCVITFVLFVAPSVIVITMTLVGYSQTAGMTRYARLVNFLNCFNMLIVTVICQKDIRRRMRRAWMLLSRKLVQGTSSNRVTSSGLTSAFRRSSLSTTVFVTNY